MVAAVRSIAVDARGTLERGALRARGEPHCTGRFPHARSRSPPAPHRAANRDGRPQCCQMGRFFAKVAFLGMRLAYNCLIWRLALKKAILKKDMAKIGVLKKNFIFKNTFFE
ncbi:unnamed protein product [Macrosiphum euphorbiae]|uniref:Uncharacterized protein n=1 Tax=Macrosiphum euphorbiae TaxID=13131 RepID=A0AAV0XN39_9HEMI|nr:unnamed protein product [Macrosiphum euphorbiae]